MRIIFQNGSIVELTNIHAIYIDNDAERELVNHAKEDFDEDGGYSCESDVNVSECDMGR